MRQSANLEAVVSNRLSVSDAAKLMGTSQQFIRIGLQRGILPFGYAIQMKKNKYTYVIIKQKFTEYTGITERV